MRYLLPWVCLSLAIATTAVAQTPPEKTDRQKAGEIAVQPARDVGVVKTETPELLQQAAKAPYSLAGLGRCAQIARAVAELNGVLGPDFESGGGPTSRKIKITGNTVAGLIIPFRGLVREVSGAAPAQRRLDVATATGVARRGFLRGVYQTRGCRPAL